MAQPSKTRNPSPISSRPAALNAGDLITFEPFDFGQLAPVEFEPFDAGDLPALDCEPIDFGQFEPFNFADLHPLNTGDNFQQTAQPVELISSSAPTLDNRHKTVTDLLQAAGYTIAPGQVNGQQYPRLITRGRAA